MTITRTDGWRAVTNAPLLIGTLGITVVAVLALFGPQLAPSDPQAQRVIIFYPDGSFAAPPTPPDAYYVLGTDPLGRDQLSRLLWGARLTVTALLLGLGIRASIGTALGVLAGWRHGGWLDRAVAYVTNAVSGIPQLMLALLVVIALRDQGMLGFILALALVGWAELAQFVRAETIRAVAMPHIEAARAVGGTGAHVARAHVLRDLGPQLVGLIALEAGSVLLLMAELGFIGFFISGGTFYTDDLGRPILPIRDRAPEWGQMLAGARHYAFQHQYVAFIPGIVVVSAVLAFNLFAEGLRKATDPFGTHRLTPRTLGRIARVAIAGLLIGAVGLGYVSARASSVSFDDGARTAREAAQRVLPGSELIAGIVRFTSESHALARPEKLNYYFRSADGTILRVGFVDADANAMEVKLHSHEDNVVFDALRPLAAWSVPWETALSAAESGEGLAFRNTSPRYIVRVVLAQDTDGAPLYRVQYAKPAGVGLATEVRVDALTGSAAVPPERYFADAISRARYVLAGPVRVESLTATWVSEKGAFASQLAEGPRFGTARPASVGVSLSRADRSGFVPFATVTYRADRAGSAAILLGNGLSAAGEVKVMSHADLVAAFSAVVDDAELRALRERTELAGRGWSITASAVARQGAPINFFFSDGSTSSAFRFDPATGRVERTR